jgi:ATP-dependent Zn proteases
MKSMDIRKPYVDESWAILMGGRAAEMLIFNKMTTGAGNDIEQATQIARKMVTEWGMSDLLGPMTFGKKNEEIFLGREIQSQRDYSEVTARMIDEEISKIIRNAQRVSESILNDNEDLLHSMAKSLLVHETIDAKDIDKLLNGKKIIKRKSNASKSSNGKLNSKRSVTGKRKSEPIKSNGKL